MAIVYDAAKMDYIRTKTRRQFPYVERGTTKQVLAYCVTHEFECQAPNQTTTGEAGDYLVDKQTTWFAVPHEEFVTKYDPVGEESQ